MTGRTPISTLTATPFPFTPHFRSVRRDPVRAVRAWQHAPDHRRPADVGQRVAVEDDGTDPESRPHRCDRRHASGHGRGRRGQPAQVRARRSEEHTSELKSLMRTSYAVFCWKKKTTT